MGATMLNRKKTRAPEDSARKERQKRKRKGCELGRGLYGGGEEKKKRDGRKS